MPEGVIIFLVYLGVGDLQFSFGFYSCPLWRDSLPFALADIPLCVIKCLFATCKVGVVPYNSTKGLGGLVRQREGKVTEIMPKNSEAGGLGLHESECPPMEGTEY